MSQKHLPSTLPTTTIAPYTPLYRSHSTTHTAEYFNHTRKGYRFSAPNGEYGILYSAIDMEAGNGMEGAFVEGLVYDALLQRARTFARTKLAEKQLSICTMSGPLRLLDLTGRGLAQIGRDNKLTVGSLRGTNRFGLQVFNHPAALDGILYPSRHNIDLRSVALFNRPSLPERHWVSLGPWDGPELWNDTLRLLEAYKLSLV